LKTWPKQLLGYLPLDVGRLTDGTRWAWQGETLQLILALRKKGFADWDNPDRRMFFPPNCDQILFDWGLRFLNPGKVEFPFFEKKMLN
jgi:hypothetical protein